MCVCHVCVCGHACCRIFYLFCAVTDSPGRGMCARVLALDQALFLVAAHNSETCLAYVCCPLSVCVSVCVPA